MRFHVNAALFCVVVGLGAGASGQSFVVTSSPLHVGEDYQFDLTGGTPNGTYILAFDVAPGPTATNLGPIALGLGASTFLAPVGTLDPTGSATLSNTLPSNATMVGKHYFGQAVCSDPGMPFGWQVSAPWSGGVHPAPVVPLTSGTIALGEDDSIAVSLTMGTFTFFDTSYTEIFVSSNGIFSFGGPVVDPTEGYVDFLIGHPKVALLWDDLSPQLQGEVWVDQAADFVRVRFEDVRQSVTEDHNWAEASFHADGSIMMHWTQVGLMDSLVGISPGASIAPGVYADFSASTQGESGAMLPILEQFWPSVQPFDLEGMTITFLPDPFSAGYVWIR